MSSTKPAISVLKGMYAAEAEYLAAGGPGSAPFTPLASFFAPDVVLYQADSLPYGGAWRGHEGLEQFFLAMSRAWDTFEMVRFTPNGGQGLTKVQAAMRSDCSKVSGLSIPIEECRRTLL